MEVETRQLDKDREEGGAGEEGGLGDRLRGRDDSLSRVTRGVFDDGEPPENADAEASGRLRANRALLALAELFGAQSLWDLGAEVLGSVSTGWLPG